LDFLNFSLLQILKISVSGAKVHSPVWAVAALPDGSIATGDSIGYTQLWDGTFGTLLHSFKTHEAAVLALCCAGDSLFCSGADSNVVRLERPLEWVVAST
jgi:WD40 repeat protein